MEIWEGEPTDVDGNKRILFVVNDVAVFRDHRIGLYKVTVRNALRQMSQA